MAVGHWVDVIKFCRRTCFRFHSMLSKLRAFSDCFSSKTWDMRFFWTHACNFAFMSNSMTYLTFFSWIWSFLATCQMDLNESFFNLVLILVMLMVTSCLGPESVASLPSVQTSFWCSWLSIWAHSTSHRSLKQRFGTWSKLRMDLAWFMLHKNCK